MSNKTQTTTQTENPKDEKLISTIRETCILVTMHGGYFNWKRRDKKVEGEVAASKGIKSKNVGQYHKNLFADSDTLLASAKAIITEARALHYTLTLASPWPGESFLRNVHVEQYRTGMTEMKHRLEAVNEQIRNDWKGMQEEAKKILGSMYNESDYPSAQEVTSQNYIETDFKPIPNTQSIILDGLDEEIRKEISDTLMAKMQTAISEANKEVWKRFITILDNAKKNLAKQSKQDGRFRTEWHDNLAEIVTLMKGLNITDNEDLNNYAREAQDILDTFTKGDLEEDNTSRAKALSEVESLFDSMSAVYKAF